jgi:hypothetical protein
VFDGQDRETLRIAPWDDHINARGHRLVAEQLYELLMENKDVLGLQPTVNLRQ